MKKTIGLMLALTASLVMADDAENSFYPYTYGEVHLGKTTTSLNGSDLDYSYLTIGGSYGYQFHPNFSSELFATFATNKENDEITSAIIGANVKNSYNAFGAYLVAKTTGNFYGKLKLGLIGSQFVYSAGGYEDESSTDVGVSYGLGIGYKADRVGIELNYLVMPEVDDPLWTQDSYDSDMLLFNLRWEL
jgi:hypothetical protein